MKILLLDTWKKTPAPSANYPDCLILKTLAATTGGDQGNVQREASGMNLFVSIMRRSFNSVRRAVAYARMIGLKRTIAKIQSNLLSYRAQLFQSHASVVGRVIDNGGDNRFPIGSLRAGFRFDCPAYLDRVLVSAEQTAAVPAGLEPENAAAIFHYALALEAASRIGDMQKTGQTIVICGNTLPCLFLLRMLADSGQPATHFPCPDTKAVAEVKANLKENVIVMIGGSGWMDLFMDLLENEHIYFMGLSAEKLSDQNWAALKNRWIGFPPSGIHQLNIFSRLPLETPSYLKQKSLEDALTDMCRRTWKPKDFMTLVEVSQTREGSRLSLDDACCFVSSDDENSNDKSTIITRTPLKVASNDKINIGIIGMGMWMRGNLIPFLLKDERVRITIAADMDSVRLIQGAELFNIPLISSNPADVCHSDQVDAVFIATWHDAHADIACMALEAGKMVFVEKPPIINGDQYKKLKETLERHSDALFFVGYNRIHLPVTKIIKDAIVGADGPITITAFVREPTISKTHYYYWPHQGSRIVSNGCHWIDYAFHLLYPKTPSDIQVISALSGNKQSNNVIIMRYDDGSIVSLTFSDRGESLIGGNETIDIKMAEQQFIIHDFITCERYKDGKIENIWKGKADRGWEQEMKDVLNGMINKKMNRKTEEILSSAYLLMEANLSHCSSKAQK